jgi:hypothetical protein
MTGKRIRIGRRLSLRQLNELRTRREPLLPELEPYLLEELSGHTILEHPLVKDLFIDLERCGHINRLYKAKAAQAKKYLAAGKYDSYVFLHERPYRVDALVQIMGKLADAEFWQLLGEVWRDSESIRQYRRERRTLWFGKPNSS